MFGLPLQNRGQQYEKMDDKSEVLQHPNDKRCTHIWLGLICALMFIQAVVIVFAGVTTLVLYDANQAKVQAWINLPWVDMAKSVDNGYDGLKHAPVADTLQNAYFSASKLRSMLEYHDKTTFTQLKSFSDELEKNKGMISDVGVAARQALPAIKQVQKLLGDKPIEDLSGILHKTNAVMDIIDQDKKNYLRATSLMDNVNNLLEPSNVNKTIHAAQIISHVLNNTLTPDNVNKTVHALNDVDESIHRAENTFAKIGSILGK